MVDFEALSESLDDALDDALDDVLDDDLDRALGDLDVDREGVNSVVSCQRFPRDSSSDEEGDRIILFLFFPRTKLLSKARILIPDFSTFFSCSIASLFGILV